MGSVRNTAWALCLGSTLASLVPFCHLCSKGRSKREIEKERDGPMGPRTQELRGPWAHGSVGPRATRFMERSFQIHKDTYLFLRWYFLFLFIRSTFARPSFYSVFLASARHNLSFGVRPSRLPRHCGSIPPPSPRGPWAHGAHGACGAVGLWAHRQALDD